MREPPICLVALLWLRPIGRVQIRLIWRLSATGEERFLPAGKVRQLDPVSDSLRHRCIKTYPFQFYVLKWAVHLESNLI